MDKVRQKILLGDKTLIFCRGQTVGEKKDRKRVKGFFRRSTKFRQLEFIEPRTKMRDFIEDPKEEIWGNLSFQA